MAYRFVLFVLLLFGATIASNSRADTQLRFGTDIQPILSAKCGKCHSDRVRKGTLDLSSMKSLLRGGESGDDLVAETLEESLLWTMIRDGDMPPEDEPRLNDDELDLIRRWIIADAPSEEPSEVETREVNQHDVLPIVLLRCAPCHGAQNRRGGLDLRTRASMLTGGDVGPAIMPGDANASRMIERIESQACPPSELLLKFFVRRPPASEVALLRNWIDAGAPESAVSPDAATSSPDPLVTDADRQHWAFQPPVAVSDINSIDHFIEKRLRDNRLEFSPQADRDTLIRRVYLDLIGMPPSVSQWKRWHDSDEPRWYEQMVDHLLDSPHYGERWGRYWLDLAGYADSEGGVSADPIRKVAWKYRDYVIKAFNEDMPYDDFLIQQIAGDELLDHEATSVITHQMVDNLVATGFLRMGIDQTGSRTMNFVPERLGVIDDAITILGEGLMGLTIGCARCHSHKYDAIPQRDYYRFKAVFQGAFDEHDWLTFKNRHLKVDVPARVARAREINPPLQAKLKKLQSKLAGAIKEERLELLRQHYPEQPEADRDETIRALRIADNNRTQIQRILVEMLQQVDVLPDEEQPGEVLDARQEIKQLEYQIATATRQLEAPILIRALWDRGEPSPTYILRRGEHDKPGHLVGPGVPSVLTDGKTPFEWTKPFPNGTPKTGRRLAFARWLTKPDHPLTARVMVNRVWYHRFGQGLVRSLENFGIKGERPTHPELLDWLAVQFVQRDWSIKELHRLMMNSRTYRQTSRISEERYAGDPQNRLLSRMRLRRMDAEALRDSLLFVSGQLDATPGGPPDTVSVDRNGLVSVNSTPEGRWRRSIYVQYRRTEIPTMMDTFDYPEMGPNCVTRSVSTVAPQSLMLINNKHIRELASALASRVENSIKGHRGQVEMIYRTVLSRSPSDDELELGIDTLNELHAKWNGEPHSALETYCHTILNSAAFLYVD